MCDNLLLNTIFAEEAAGGLDEATIPTHKVRIYWVHQYIQKYKWKIIFLSFMKIFENIP